MRSVFAALVLVVAALPAAVAQAPSKAAYRLSFDPKTDVVLKDQDELGKPGIFVYVRFLIQQIEETTEDVHRDYKILIKEEGRIVREVDVPRPKISDDISAILAVDMSGSMTEGGKVGQAKKAGGVFFDKMPAKAECGLILFDHALRFTKGPSKDRALLRRELDAALPGGGTAYLDAAAKAIELLKQSPAKNKVAVVMTDGVDLNSKRTMQEVIQQAQMAGVKVFTIGIGEPGTQELVTSVLALDKSGSMLLPADDRDKVTKIEALKTAAVRFVNSMRPQARTTVLDFSDAVSVPAPFTNKREQLRSTIGRLQAKGETAFLDAAYTAIMTLEAENPPGKKAVVVLTDGIDNSSRHRADEVVKVAQEAKIPLHMLGFGRENEIDSKVMNAIAKPTGGKFFHAKNQKSLLEIFEKLSIELHDDGIDEVALQQLASRTGGLYFPAKKVSELQQVLQTVSEKIPTEDLEVIFPSLRQVADGTRRNITLELVRRGQVIQLEEGTTQVRGVVVAEMSPFWYLALLVLLGTLLVVPAGMRAIFKGGTSA